MGSRDERIDVVSSHPSVRRVASVLAASGDSVWLVGGAVRDILIGREPSEIDLVVEGSVGGPAAALAEALGGEAEVHSQFGTARVGSESLRVDLASARAEVYRRPGALPDVSPAPIEADLGRRDFSINAITVSLTGDREGEMLAWPGALEDLDAGVVRVLHERSFEDDPTRLWRMARYCGRLGFSADGGTSILAEQAVSEDRLLTVSPARNGAELRRSCDAREPRAVLETTARMGLLQGVGARPDAIGLLDRAVSIAEGLDPCRLRIVAAFAGVNEAEELANGLQLGRAMVHAAAEGARHPRLIEALRQASLPSEVRAAASGASREAIALAGAAGASAASAVWFDRVDGVSLPFDGGSLVDRGLTGEKVGLGLEIALDFMLDTGVSDAEALLEQALEGVRSG